jgi:hypothetical protein
LGVAAGKELVRRRKWFIYTVLLGVIPLLTRAIVYGASPKSTGWEWLSEADLIAFAFVLCITNLNALEHEEGVDRSWKTTTNGLSIALIFLAAVIFALSCVIGLNPGTFKPGILKLGAGLVAFGSFALGWSTYTRLNAVNAAGVDA